jgi:hypothetical protein
VPELSHATYTSLTGGSARAEPVATRCGQPACEGALDDPPAPQDAERGRWRLLLQPVAAELPLGVPDDVEPPTARLRSAWPKASVTWRCGHSLSVRGRGTLGRALATELTAPPESPAPTPTAQPMLPDRGLPARRAHAPGFAAVAVLTLAPGMPHAWRGDGATERVRRLGSRATRAVSASR